MKPRKIDVNKKYLWRENPSVSVVVTGSEVLEYDLFPLWLGQSLSEVIE